MEQNENCCLHSDPYFRYINLMNYLAHLYLSDRSEKGFLGSLLGDFYKTGDNDRYDQTIMDWTRFHWETDRFTDTHPDFITSKKRAALALDRFSGIYIDIYYDHFLARDWVLYSNLDLKAFSQKVYAVLEANMGLLPERLKRLSAYMIRQDWLNSYADLEGVRQTFERLNYRTGKPGTFSQGCNELKKNYPLYRADFQRFFPELRRFSAEKSPAPGKTA
jgi:acyl carrier protein phosphodiesterase